jgi:hypothetical protein
MARISFDSCIAVADQIAARNFPEFTPAIRPFAMFGLDMTKSIVHSEDGISMAAMVKENGQRESERQLWKIEKVAPERAAVAAAAERAERLAEMESAYNVMEGELPVEGFELECDPITFATGLAKASWLHNKALPTFLLDSDGEL